MLEESPNAVKTVTWVNLSVRKIDSQEILRFYTWLLIDLELSVWIQLLRISFQFITEAPTHPLTYIDCSSLK